METPPDFNWVQARHACSLDTAFARLALQVRGDCDVRNGLRAERGETVKFAVTEHGDRFAVVAEGWRASVTFTRQDDQVVIAGSGLSAAIQASLRLTQDGICVWHVAGADLLPWQLAKQALEGLLFPVRSDAP